MNTRLIGPAILSGTILGLLLAALPDDQRQLESAMWRDYCQGVAQWQSEANQGVPASERFGHPDYDGKAHRCPPTEGASITVTAGIGLAAN
ncbi:hypothetical protein SAMN05216571_101373 [Onishia taeanensis]|uniref:Uncharacterized protein n=1 Tax=Onishia taeanensis TaxID=284577 RepID=A0A1G7NDH5_9GAMM|nr:hypothetical protein [Halomonas taeanensis]SDF72006.1 hypothetical protein SAMN05216571_101373 [Halomonas taeanensis]